jgi:hypothetical protein
MGEATWADEAEGPYKERSDATAKREPKCVERKLERCENRGYQRWCRRNCWFWWHRTIVPLPSQHITVPVFYVNVKSAPSKTPAQTNAMVSDARVLLTHLACCAAPSMGKTKCPVSPRVWLASTLLHCHHLILHDMYMWLGVKSSAGNCRLWRYLSLIHRQICRICIYIYNIHNHWSFQVLKSKVHAIKFM